jgi:hypothetical protein
MEAEWRWSSTDMIRTAKRLEETLLKFLLKVLYWKSEGPSADVTFFQTFNKIVKLKYDPLVDGTYI